MSLNSLDLNLLLPLQALLQERNVSKAAERLGVGQSAMSTRLARLRRHFGDDLLERSGNGYTLTPLATELLDRSEVAVSWMNRVFSVRREFDPETSDREFKAVMSDYTLTLIGASLSTLMEREAPGVRLHIDQFGSDFAGDTIHALRTTDVAILPHVALRNIPYLNLFRDDWVCLVADDNGAVGHELRIEQLSRLPWVAGYDWPMSPIAHQLHANGIVPQVRISIESFAMLPHMIAGTSRIAAIQRRLAHRIVNVSQGVRVVECPLKMEPIVEAIWWHPMHQSDSAHQWLRDLFVRAAKSVTGDD